MRADIDHVVLWVDDPLRSVAFYTDVIGLEPLRVEDFKAKRSPFPSVRLSESAVIDFAPRAMAPAVNAIARKAGVGHDAAGTPMNHLCVAVSRNDFVALRGRLEKAGVDTSFALKDAFGARGEARETFYFADPDGNVIEARYYEPAS